MSPAVIPTIINGTLPDTFMPARLSATALDLKYTPMSQSTARSSSGFLTFSGTASQIPTVKPSGDTRPGVWEMTHGSSVGYIYHLLASGDFTNGSALVAMGLDNTGGGAGLLIANKSKSLGLVINQQSTISDGGAYGIKITGQTTLAPSVRLEQNVNGAADALQIATFGTPTDTQHGLFISDPAGESWSTFPVDGRLEGKRDLRIREKNSSTRTVIGVGENSAFPWGSLTGYTTQLGKDRLTFYSPSGGNSLWSYAWVAGGSGINLMTGAAGAFGAIPANSVIAVKNNQIGFLGTAAISKRAATPDATDLASVITLANQLKADLVAYGLKS